MKLPKLIFGVLAVFVVCQSATAQTPPCKYTSGETTYDFTKIAGKEVTVTEGDYNYNLNICGTSSMECPNDPNGVTSGMAVQTHTSPSPYGDYCYVLGQYDATANWSPRKFSLEVSSLSLY